MILMVLAVIVYIIIIIIAADEFHHIAVEKGYDEAKYFWYPLLFGIIGHLMVVALPDKKLRNAYSCHTAENCSDTPEQKRTPLISPNPSHISHTPETSEQENITCLIEELTQQEDTTPEVIITADHLVENDSFECPNCGKVQKLGRAKCFKCGASLTYKC